LVVDPEGKCPCADEGTARCEGLGWIHVTRRTQIERVFENRMLRKVSRLNMDKVTGGLRKVHNEKLHNLHSS
jgi:hypothetical protein